MAELRSALSGDQFAGQQQLFETPQMKEVPQSDEREDDDAERVPQDPNHLRGSQIPGQRMLDVHDRGYNHGPPRSSDFPFGSKERYLGVKPGIESTHAEVTRHGYHHDTTVPIEAYRQYGVSKPQQQKKWKDAETRTFGPDYALFTGQPEDETMMSGQGYLDKMQKNVENLKEPWVGRYKGQDIIFDGHHRISAFRHAREGSFKGKFRDLDAEKKAEWDYPEDLDENDNASAEESTSMAGRYQEFEALLGLQKKPPSPQSSSLKEDPRTLRTDTSVEFNSMQPPRSVMRWGSKKPSPPQKRTGLAEGRVPWHANVARGPEAAARKDR